MPQLHIETFVTQYFWLVVCLFVFYYINAVEILPSISEILKIRQKLEISKDEKKEKDIEGESIKEGKSIITEASTIKQQTIIIKNTYNKELSVANINWVNKIKI